MAAKSEYARAHERQQNRDIYNWYKSRGICPKCKEKHGAPGHVYCEDCLTVKREEMQKYLGAYNAAKCKERRERPGQGPAGQIHAAQRERELEGGPGL